MDTPVESAWSLRADWTAPLRRRPLPVALAAAAVLALLTWRIGPRADLPAFLVLGVAGTALAAVDVALRRLPDPLTLPLYGAGRYCWAPPRRSRPAVRRGCCTR
ncbi:hypothetical protein GCM10010191_14870 [Actinomadura vinacea]|uniref:Uncharacterized protein n=1 Tax=Actinomadura vinacea TaxID=115336 RepID=A0ABP5VS75_9ACTN